mmetsp:Transcript_31797/g.83300  ORF Transcript_31797/g.83300 Transcript_31797/m.83300 type:complete len:212 (-) Transcript_31797:1004-1639(-)
MVCSGGGKREADLLDARNNLDGLTLVCFTHRHLQLVENLREFSLADGKHNRPWRPAARIDRGQVRDVALSRLTRLPPRRGHQANKHCRSDALIDWGIGVFNGLDKRQPSPVFEFSTVRNGARIPRGRRPHSLVHNVNDSRRGVNLADNLDCVDGRVKRHFSFRRVEELAHLFCSTPFELCEYAGAVDDFLAGPRNLCPRYGHVCRLVHRVP